MRAGFYVAAGFLLCLPALRGQESALPADMGTRQLWDDNLKQLRPPNPNRPAVRRTAPRPQPKAPGPQAVGDAFVGVTLWHLRPSRRADEPGTRLLVHEEESGTREEFTPERVSADAPLTEGARIRVSIEAAREGYLYVVDREQYADGSYSDPWLIFPTTQIRNGNNKVQAGTVIEIPDSADKIPYMRLRRNRARRTSASGESPEQVSEVLTVLVSPTPLPGLRIGRAAQKLPANQFALWEKQWATQTKAMDAPAHVGKPYTAVEKLAAQGGGVLTADDPLPQTIIQSQAKPGDPLMVTVPIRIAKK